jgi:hypothetical protein
MALGDGRSLMVATDSSASPSLLGGLGVYLHLTNDWLASEYQRAAGRIDDTAVAELLGAQEPSR